MGKFVDNNTAELSFKLWQIKTIETPNGVGIFNGLLENIDPNIPLKVLVFHNFAKLEDIKCPEYVYTSAPEMIPTLFAYSIDDVKPYEAKKP